ncbi:hypothetical protein V2W45_1372090 [Cenococcum geophilum]
MFQYRHELRRHFLLIILPNIFLSIASLFGYSFLCHAVGIAPSKGLSFVSHSLISRSCNLPQPTLAAISVLLRYCALSVEY